MSEIQRLQEELDNANERITELEEEVENLKDKDPA
jgi:predicted  nucleic acid-binding Zn-ribbon protein